MNERFVASIFRITRAPAVRRTGSVALAILLSKLLTLAALGYAARSLGPESWGLVGAALAVVAYASVVLSPGLMAWGAREIARDHARTPTILVMVNLTQIAFATVAYLAIVAASDALLQGRAAQLTIAISATSLFAQALSVDWVFDGLEQPQTGARLQALGSAARMAMVMWLCRQPSDVYVYAALLPLSMTLQAAAGSLLLWRLGVFELRWPGLPNMRSALTAAWPLGLTTSLFLIVHNANTLIVEFQLGSRAAGHYLAAFRVLEMASVLPGVLSAVFRPRMARLSSTDRGRAEHEARLYERGHLLAGFLIASLLYAESPRIIAALYGQQYLEAVPLLRVFSVAVAANYLVCGSTNCLQSFGGDRALLRSILVAASVSISAGLVLTPWYGTKGAAFAASLIHPITWLAALGDYRRFVGPVDFASWMRPAAAAVAVVAASWWLEAHGSGIAVSVVFYMLVYSVTAAHCWIELFAAASSTSRSRLRGPCPMPAS